MLNKKPVSLFHNKVYIQFLTLISVKTLHAETIKIF